MINLVDIFLNLDHYLNLFIQTYHTWVYLLLFLIIFAETGLVIFPFLPGDSLLFAIGALAGTGAMNIWLVFIVLVAAAIIGDSVNYWLGHRAGSYALNKKYGRFITPENLRATEQFYKRHGDKTILFARFVPIIRTIAPFVAGVGRMHYSSFLFYNILGAITWIALFLFTGFFFGNIPFVKQQLHWVIVGIIALSIIPILWKFISKKLKS